MTSAASADLSSLAESLNYASKVGATRAANLTIRGYAERVRTEAQTMVPVKTGELRDSIQIRYPNIAKAVIGPTKDYGVYQEFGTASRGEFGGSPYEIRPKSPDGRLVFKVNGKWVSAKRVIHPGIPPQPYMRPALQGALGNELASNLAQQGALMAVQGKNALPAGLQ